MMRHSQLHRSILLDMIRHAAETGAPMPTDHEIMDRFGFESPEQARTLLADLSDRAEIVLSYSKEGDRSITLASRKAAARRPGAAASRPIRSVVKPATKAKQRTPEETAQRIMDIVKRPAGPKVDAPAPLPKAPRAAAPLPQPVAPPTPAPAAAPGPPVAIPGLPPIVKAPPLQINCKPSEEVSRIIWQAALEEGVPVGRKATEILSAAVLGTPPAGVLVVPASATADLDLEALRGVQEATAQLVPAEPPLKPIVTPDMLRAFHQSGAANLHAFVGEVMRLGLSLLREQRSVAEAVR